MAVTERAARIAPYVERLLEDEGARESLREGIEKVREAYERSQKRGVDPTVDKKLWGQLIAAAQRLNEGAGKLAQGREKPKKRGRKLLIAVAVGVGGFGLALAASEGLRSRLFGSGSPAEAGGAEGGHR